MTTPHVEKRGLLALPGIIFSVFPTVVCPACWPAYTGLLSAVGIPFLPTSAYLLPMTGIFLLVAIAALAFRANQRRGYGPFLLGLLAAMVVLLGRFVFHVQLGTYAGVGLLVGASLWNSGPRPAAVSPSCALCAPAETKEPTQA
jgi:hypothetical protein